MRLPGSSITTARPIRRIQAPEHALAIYPKPRGASACCVRAAHAWRYARTPASRGAPTGARRGFAPRRQWRARRRRRA